jgi:hypothetical protein
MTTFFRPSARILACLAALAAICAPAQANLLTNGSFESAVPGVTGTTTQYCYSCANDGWTGSAVVIKSNSTAWGVPSGLGNYSYGSQLIGLQNSTYVEQSLSLAAGTYLLTWADAGRRNYQSTMYDVLFNGALLNATSFSTLPGQAWSTHSLSFTTSGVGALRFQGLAVNNDGTAFIDNLSLTMTSASTVPEPASLGLVALALAGLAAGRRRSGQRAG